MHATTMSFAQSCIFLIACLDDTQAPSVQTPGSQAWYQTTGPCLLRLCSADVERYRRVGQDIYHMGVSCNSLMQWPRAEALHGM